jgi:ABC-type polar amino acid transport system ATPase subunit
MSSPPPMLEAIDVCKIYEGRAVVNGVSFDVHPGEVKVIIGPSGSGKSTLLRCLALLESTDSGEIRLAGKVIGRAVKGHGWFGRERELANERSNIGMVFQHFELFPHLTAEDNVVLGLVTVRRLSRDKARTRAREVLRRVGVEDRSHAYPSELSGGQQQRVAIARALVMDPKVLLFDEPTSALDAELVREVLDVMEELAAGGMTMVVVTHELKFARKAANHVAMMSDGMLIEESDPESFFTAPAHQRTRQFLDHIA